MRPRDPYIETTTRIAGWILTIIIVAYLVYFGAHAAAYLTG